MTTHVGLLYEPVNFVPAKLSGDTTVDPSFFTNITGLFSRLGTEAEGTPTVIVDTEAGLKLLNVFPADLILERVYLFPQLIEAGIIVSAQQYDINIWNAHEATFREIQNITGFFTTGTDLIYPAIPIELTPESIYQHELTIFLAGPPVQDTDYVYTIDADIYTVEITGERLVAIKNAFEPNWRAKVKIKLRFNTSVNRSKRFVEQRRPLYDDPKRIMFANFWFNELTQQTLVNDLKKFNIDLLAIPVYPEALTPISTVLSGTGAITFDEELEDFLHLINYTEFLVVKSRYEAGLNEIVVISSIDTGTNTITLSSSLVNDYVMAETVVYPIFLGNIIDFRPTYRTDDLANFELQFEEIKQE